VLGLDESRPVSLTVVERLNCLGVQSNAGKCPDCGYDLEASR
jgi:hypothetical protein